jgi:hypothetical protein
MVKWLLGTTREALHPRQIVILAIQYAAFSIGSVVWARSRGGLSWPLSLLVMLVAIILGPPLLWRAWVYVGRWKDVEDQGTAPSGGGLRIPVAGAQMSVISDPNEIRSLYRQELARTVVELRDIRDEFPPLFADARRWESLQRKLDCLTSQVEGYAHNIKGKAPEWNDMFQVYPLFDRESETSVLDYIDARIRDVQDIRDRL